jgi:hypothetical protein
MRRKVIAFSAIATIALAVVLWKGRAQQPAQPDLSGEWELVSAVGTTPPDGFVMQVNQSSTTLRVRDHWNQPANDQYGLTLVGLLAPELTFSIDGREDLNQAGPFVIHSHTRRNGTRMVTTWSTSELMGMSFKGQWVRSVSADGRESTLEVHADSSQRQHSDATLKFRKK